MGAGVTHRLYVHDFVRIDLPVDTVVTAFVNYVSPEMLSELARDAWRGEANEVLAVVDDDHLELSAEALGVVLGDHRGRHDAVVVPLTWVCPGVDRWVPSLEADLEIVGFGPVRTHLHLLGLSSLAQATEPFSERASLEHRLTVAVVRHFLARLAEVINSAVEVAPAILASRTGQRPPS